MERKLHQQGLQRKHDTTQKVFLLKVNLKNPGTPTHEQHLALMSLKDYMDEKESGNNLVSFDKQINKQINK